MIVRNLKVFLWEREIGRLAWDERRKIGIFEFSRDFLSGELDPFPIVAPLGVSRNYPIVEGGRADRTGSHLPPFIADSLPDSWGNSVFEYWRSANGIRNGEITPLDKLSFIGRRAMGALEFVPDSSPAKESEEVNLQKLIELSQRIFAERESVKILPGESLTAHSLIAVGTSAGGRQPKAILAINPETGEIRSGQVAGREGFEYCILKFGDAERSSAELEMAYYEMATAAGIKMAPCRLLDVEGKKHFLTRRFDREGGEKLHMQTLAALAPEATSYEDLLRVCRKLKLPEPTQTEVFRRLVFNILANNTDDHNKNFSFLMDRGGHWALAPAYDVTYIFNAGGFRPETDRCLFARGKLSGFTREDILGFAKDNGILRAESVIRQVVAAVSRFREFAQKHGVREQWTSAVEATIAGHLQSWGYGGTSSANIRVGETLFENVHIERAYRGNFHLYATVKGKEKKFVIGKNREEYEHGNQQPLRGAARCDGEEIPGRSEDRENPGDKTSQTMMIDYEDADRLPYLLTGTGKTVAEAKTAFLNGHQDMKEFFSEKGMPFEDISFSFRYDIPSFLQEYACTFTLSGLEKVTGVNQKQLGRYISGFRHPSRKTAKKIESGIRRLGQELSEVKFL